MRTPFFPGIEHVLGVEKKQAEGTDDQYGKGNRDDRYRIEKPVVQDVFDGTLGVKGHRFVS
jgi:hypothetical protein